MIKNNIKTLDTIVLQSAHSQQGLQAGDVGVVVEIYDAGGFEVEFVTGSGKTQAVLTLQPDDVRPIAADEILAIRSINAA